MKRTFKIDTNIGRTLFMNDDENTGFADVVAPYEDMAKILMPFGGFRTVMAPLVMIIQNKACSYPILR